MFTMDRTVVGQTNTQTIQLEVAVVITTDCVVLAKKQGSKYTFLKACSRGETEAKLLGKKATPLGFKIVMRGSAEVQLTAATADSKTEWVALLNDRTTGYKPENALTGERSFDARPSERQECLEQMGSPDPQTFEGAVLAYRQNFVFEDTMGSHSCSLEVIMRMHKSYSTQVSILSLPVDTVNSVQTPKAQAR
jgi:hypothetical protein